MFMLFLFSLVSSSARQFQLSGLFQVRMISEHFLCWCAVGLCLLSVCTNISQLSLWFLNSLEHLTIFFSSHPKLSAFTISNAVIFCTHFSSEVWFRELYLSIFLTDLTWLDSLTTLSRLPWPSDLLKVCCLMVPLVPTKCCIQNCIPIRLITTQSKRNISGLIHLENLSVLWIQSPLNHSASKVHVLLMSAMSSTYHLNFLAFGTLV